MNFNFDQELGISADLISISLVFVCYTLCSAWQARSPHTWVEHNYKPGSTMCDQCGSILYGLSYQGMKCEGRL